VEHRVQRVDRNRKHTHVRNKYGIKREIVFASEDPHACLVREIELIAEFHTFIDDPLASNIVCNLTPGGEGAKHATATKQQIRQTVTSQWQNAAFRTTRQALMKGKKRSDETRRLLSEIGRGRKLSPEAIEKRSCTNTGSKRSESTREKMRAARKAWWERKKAAEVAT
jgi:hypothetical protein